MIFIKDFLLLLKAEFKRDLIFMVRYPLEIISFLFFMYAILLAIFFGFSQLALGNANVLNREKMIIGYCLMQFVLSTQMGWSGQIQNESQTGTLEQLSISGHSFGEVLFARGLSQLPRQILSFFCLLSAYTFSIQNVNISISTWIEGVLSLCIMAIGIFGISYIFAGLTLLFKRVGFFFQIINFAFLGLFWQDRSKLSDGGVTAFLYDHFPLTMGMASLQNIFSGGKFVSHVPSLFELFISSMIFCVIGFYIFQLMENKAKEHGLLSQY